jgi:hypothetical protein
MASELGRLDRFLRSQGIDFIRIRRDFGNYGWPSYVVMFGSEEQSAAFQRSKTFDALIQEVQTTHKGLAGFEADRAVSVGPIVRSQTITQ